MCSFNYPTPPYLYRCIYDRLHQVLTTYGLTLASFQNGRLGSHKNSHQKTNPDPSGDDSGPHLPIWSYIWYLFALVATAESLYHSICCSLHRLGIHLQCANSKPRRSDFRGCKEVENMEILLRLLSYVPD